MVHALESLEPLKRQWGSARIALFLDFDGTLAPIVDVPGKARLARGVRVMLEEIAADPLFDLAIISGRALDDIRDRVGVGGIIYVGNHGLEIEGPGITFKATLPSAYLTLLGSLKEGILGRLADYKGAFVEDKGPSLSVHYRLVDQDRQADVEAMLQGLAGPHIAEGRLHVSRGKKVFELRPPVAWDKGKAVLWILGHWESSPVYIGDDVTDEDAFLALKGKGVTVYVGGCKPSHAGYWLADIDEVVDFLGRLREIRGHE